MVKPLQEILEMQFNLLYFLNMSVADFENMQLKEINFMYGLLRQQKEKETNARKPKQSVK